MPHWEYSYRVRPEEEERIAKASLREVSISPKAAVEVCREIKGMTLDKARRYLEEVVEMKRPVPFKRSVKHIGHRRELQGWKIGRYPVKVAKYMLKLLDNLENNAINKGLDPSRLRIIHAATLCGRKVKKYIPRAFGRSTPYFDTLVHIEMIAREE
ncbi:50S ribosomal protein L22 [Candidatus Geothermarchaeota archaeon]|nr:MAG: 50S ribosomal protein L22 [Candidatus Geothermarchaeota archaeon]